MNHDKFVFWHKIESHKDNNYHFWFCVDKKTRKGVHLHGRQSLKTDDKIFLRDANHYGFYPFGVEKHSPTPLFEGQEPSKNCVVTGGDCYCDGTSMGAFKMYQHLDPNEDPAYVFRSLEIWYYNWFDDEFQSLATETA